MYRLGELPARREHWLEARRELVGRPSSGGMCTNDMVGAATLEWTPPAIRKLQQTSEATEAIGHHGKHINLTMVMSFHPLLENLGRRLREVMLRREPLVGRLFGDACILWGRIGWRLAGPTPMAKSQSLGKRRSS